MPDIPESSPTEPNAPQTVPSTERIEAQHRKPTALELKAEVEAQAPPPAAQAPPVSRWRKFTGGEGRRYRRGQQIGLIILKGGLLSHHAIQGPFVKDETGYYRNEGPLFYVEKTIPRGAYVRFWPESDPEPFTAREPRGYGAKYLRNLFGGLRSAAALSGLDNPGLTRGMRLALFAAVTLAVAGIAWYFFFGPGAR